MSYRSKTVNELLGGTGSSTVSTLYNMYFQYQSVKNAIEDRGNKRKDRLIEKNKYKITAVNNAVTEADKLYNYYA